jgi:hypothetical protein
MEKEIKEKKSNLLLASFCALLVGHIAHQASWRLVAGPCSHPLGSSYLDGRYIVFSRDAVFSLRSGGSGRGGSARAGLDEGKRGGYASAKQNFPRKTGTAAVRDHVITTRRADAAEPSRCRRMRRGSR